MSEAIKKKILDVLDTHDDRLREERGYGLFFRDVKQIIDALPAETFTDGVEYDFKRDAILKRGIETFGSEAQVRMAIEEPAELIQAICKYYRSNAADTSAAIDHVLEEMADCKLAIRQLELIFGCTKEWELFKLNRFEKLINKSEQAAALASKSGAGEGAE